MLSFPLYILVGMQKNAYQVRKPTRSNARVQILVNILKDVLKQEIVLHDALPREF